MKKILAFVLVLSLALSLAVTAFAANSPTSAPVVDPTTGETIETIGQTTFKSEAEKQKLVSVRSQGDTEAVISVLWDKDYKQFKVAVVGDGKRGVFATTPGRKYTKVTVSSDLETVTFSKKAFRGGKIAEVVIESAGVEFKGEAFKWARQKAPTIRIKGSTKASQVKVTATSFKGTTAKAKIIVGKQMSSKEFKKLVKKLRAAGFIGTIKRGN